MFSVEFGTTVDHMIAVESSDPVTMREPSSEMAIQLTLSSWSANVSSKVLFLVLETELPIVTVSLLYAIVVFAYLHIF